MATPGIPQSKGKLPLVFEKNQGQAGGTAQFLAHAGRYTLLLNPGEISFSEQGRDVIRMRLEGGNRRAAIQGEQLQASYSNYYLGNDPQQWRTHVPHFGRVRYGAVYPGVDLVFHGNDRQLEYDFVLAPGADPAQIELSFAGAKSVQVDKSGDLVLQTPAGELRQHAPVVYQEGENGQRQIVAGHYVRKGNGYIGFELARYDRRKQLVIDPLLSYATYLGGSGNDYGHAIATDVLSYIYLGGQTTSTDFPVTANAAQKTNANGSNSYYGDGFVAKLSPDGASLIYATYFGGIGTDDVRALAIDTGGNLYATGTTGSNNLPTTAGAYRTTSTIGSGDSFVIKLAADGTIRYATYLAGNNSYPIANAIVVDTAGRAYVAGSANFTGYPTSTGAYQTTLKGGSDAFVTVLNAAGNGIVYSTLLGGTGAESANAIVLTSGGSVVIAGSTAPVYNSTPDFPTTTGVVQTKASGQDAFVTQLNTGGTALAYSTLLGGQSDDSANALAIDASDNLYVTGNTASLDFPTTPSAYQTVAGSGFITKLNSSATSLLYSTYFNAGYTYGCSYTSPLHGCEGGAAIAVDSIGNAYVVGTTSKSNFSTTLGALQTSGGSSTYYPASQDAFLLRLNAAGNFLDYATLLGGSSGDSGEGVAVDSAGNVYITGTTSSTNLPVTTDALQPANGIKTSNSSLDAYMVKISMQPGTCSVGVMPTTLSLPASASTGHLTITAPAGCPWYAYSAYNGYSTDWLMINSGASGVGRGQLNYAATLNYSNSARTSNIILAGQTVSVNQAALPCTYTLQPTSLDAPISGGVGHVRLLTPTGCTWSVAVNAPWISVTNVTSAGSSSLTTGTGDGDVQYSVQANTGSSRTGTITIGDQSFTITQPGPGCTFSLSLNSATFGGGGGSSSVFLTTDSNCAWSVASNAAWLRPAITSGTGSASVVYFVDANTSTTSRTGTLAIGGQTYTVTQAPIPCTYSVSPLSASVPYGGGSGIVTVTTTPSCSWTSISGASWLSITPTSLTTGSGTLTYIASANNSLARTGTLTVAGQTVTINQAQSTLAGVLVNQIGIFRTSGQGGVLWVRDRNGDGLFTGAPDTAVGVGVIGGAGDLPVTGDWNGNGTKKLGIYRPFGSILPGASLFVLDYDGSENWNGAVDKALYFPAQAGDVPLVGRWNGGTQDRVGIFRNGVFYLDANGDGSFSKVITLGQSGDVPVVGDWNGSGTTKVGIFRNGLWVLDYNGNGQWDGTTTDRAFYLGTAGDQTVIGDWNGDGRAKVGVFRKSAQLWVLDYNGNGQWDGIGPDKALYNGFDTSTSIAVTGDWMGDGKTRAGVFKDGTWFLDIFGDGSFARLGFLGQAGDTPIAGKW